MRHVGESCLVTDSYESNDPLSDTGGPRTTKSDLTAIGISPVDPLKVFALSPLPLRVRPSVL